MLDAGIGWRLFDFFRVFFFNFNSVLPGNEMVIFFIIFFFGGWGGGGGRLWFLAFFCNIQCCFTKMIYISMLHRLNVFFSHFS